MMIEILEDRIAPASITVLNLNDSGPGSLRDAIETTNSSLGTNQITFSKHLHGTIHLKTVLPNIDTSVSIASPAPNQIAIDAGNQFRIFDVVIGSEVDFVGLKLTHGRADIGGAIKVQDTNGTVNMRQCLITGNTAIGNPPEYAGGGGIAVTAGTLNVTSSKITGNLALGAVGPDPGYAQGGGLYVGANGKVIVTSSLISGNKAIGSKGIVAVPGAAGTPGNSSTQGGSGSNGSEGSGGATAYGGGIFNAGYLTVSKSTVSGNKAVGGAGADGSRGGNGGAFGGNGGIGGDGGAGGDALGGGIFISGGSTTNVISSTVSANAAVGGAGGKAGAGGSAGTGLYHSGGKTMKGIKGKAGSAGSTAEGNSVEGGGICSQRTSTQMNLEVGESTIAGNSAGEGGGVELFDAMVATIDNCTIAFNKATQGASGLEWSNAAATYSVEVVSTIVGQNKESSTVFDVSGISDFQYSLFQTADPTGTQPAGVANVIGHSADLTALGNHGGPTQTCLPSTHGPAIGTGFNPYSDQSDQRGDPRTNQDFLTDIGSVQLS